MDKQLDVSYQDPNIRKNIVFIDPSIMIYNVNTPMVQPLGGTHTACCYQAKEMAKTNNVMFINKHPTCTIDSIQHVQMPNTVEELLTILFNFNTNILIEINSAFILSKFPLDNNNINFEKIAYIQHDSNQEAVKNLKNEDRYINKYILVSNYQKNKFIQDFNINENKILIFRNGISPFCHIETNNIKNLLNNKKLQLIYCSTPWRGLEYLIDMFPKIKNIFPEIELLVFSSLKTYQITNESEYQSLYDKCKNSDGIIYKGSVNQEELSEYLKSSIIMLYPNVFPETSCISVMEAMATGNLVITSKLGALMETTDGFGFHCDIYNEYLEKTIDLIKKWKNDRTVINKYLTKQISNFQNKNRWSERIMEHPLM